MVYFHSVGMSVDMVKVGMTVVGTASETLMTFETVSAHMNHLDTESWRMRLLGSWVSI